MHRLTTTMLFAVLLTAPVFAGKVKTVTVSNPSQYDKASSQQVVVSSEGTVRLARFLKPLAGEGPFDAARIWDVVEDNAGNLYAATGDTGKIFKIATDGAATVAYSGKDSQILCLLAATDGSIYAGTGPSGTIVRIDPAGHAAVLSETRERYVWALAYDDKSQTLYAATGPHGTIFKVAADGKAVTYFKCKQDHILSMVHATDGTIYAGTDKQGLVYRIDDKGKGFLLFQASQDEVRCLQLTDNGLYAGTSSPSGGRSGGGSASGERGSGVAIFSRSNAVAANAGSGKTPLATGSRERDADSERTGPASAPVPAGNGENSVYRIGFDGSVREVFREKGLVLTLLKLKDRLFVGTGSKGQLFEIHEATRERSEVARLDHGQINRLFPRKDGSVIVAAGDPGKLFVLQDRFAAKGSVLSEVIDAKLISKFGSISWQADVPKGTKLTVAVRAGNVAEPDETWSDWSAEMDDPKASAAKTPAARYLQWRLSLSTDDVALSPALHNLSIRFATLNQAPEVTSLDVPNLEAVSVKDPKKLKIKWSATDPNEDELAFDIFVRKAGWKDWVKVEDGWSKTDYEWDTTTIPSGSYRVKVVASDRPDNNEEDALTGERVSEPVIVAHEPPAVSLKMASVEKGRAAIEARAESSLVRLTSATFAIDGGKWSNVFPTDGLFDSKLETFRFPTESLSPGTHVVVLKVRDAAGNTGSADVVFTVPREK